MDGGALLWMAAALAAGALLLGAYQQPMPCDPYRELPCFDSSRSFSR
jgi:hypothetical protein